MAPGVEPQLDTPADLGKRINVKLQEIPKAEPVVQDALIREAYDLLRAWSEAFVEHISAMTRALSLPRTAR